MCGLNHITQCYNTARGWCAPNSVMYSICPIFGHNGTCCYIHIKKMRNAKRFIVAASSSVSLGMCISIIWVRNKVLNWTVRKSKWFLHKISNKSTICNDEFKRSWYLMYNLACCLSSNTTAVGWKLITFRQPSIKTNQLNVLLTNCNVDVRQTEYITIDI